MANYATSALKLSDTYVNTLPYNTCATAAGTAAKTVDAGTFSLETGAMVVVKFTTTNTAANPTLNVSSTGAKAIYYNGVAITADYLKANKVYEFVYNGTQWDLIGGVEHSASDITSGTLSSDRLPTVPASKGGTGKTTLQASTYALIDSLSTGDSTPDDEATFITEGVGASYRGKYYRRPMTSLWNYIKSKADSAYATKTELNNKAAVQIITWGEND